MPKTHGVEPPPGLAAEAQVPHSIVTNPQTQEHLVVLLAQDAIRLADLAKGRASTSAEGQIPRQIRSHETALMVIELEGKAKALKTEIGKLVTETKRETKAALKA